MNILAMSPCAAKIWDYASPIMLLKIAIIMLLSMLEILLLFYTSLANQFRSYKLRMVWPVFGKTIDRGKLLALELR